jgi:hypothetical protein
MQKSIRTSLFLAVISPFFVFESQSVAANGWSPVVIARGSYRAQLQSMPIESRPNRPFHFYGNAVRRANAQPRVSQPRISQPRAFQPSTPSGAVYSGNSVETLPFSRPVR